MGQWIRFSTLAMIMYMVLADDSPGFFLKVSKNVPRIGRRSGSEFENFFLKQSKSVPRIGRRGYVDSSNPEETVGSWYQRYVQPGKRMSELDTENFIRNYNLVQPFDIKVVLQSILSNDEKQQSKLKFVSWDDFDQALQSDTQLFVKLSSIARDKEIEELKKILQEEKEAQISLGLMNGGVGAPQFIPLHGSANFENNKLNGKDNYYYRADRSYENDFYKINLAAQNGKLNKEIPQNI